MSKDQIQTLLAMGNVEKNPGPECACVQRYGNFADCPKISRKLRRELLQIIPEDQLC